MYFDAFYDSTVREVSNSDETRNHDGYSDELIRLGCMKFVTPASTRAMVKRTHERVGRLPYYIVKQLVDRHLLRCEKRGDDEWFELSHDHLIKPIGRRKDRKFSALLYASDVLDKMLEQAVEENGGHLEGYFKPHHDILKEWEPLRAKAVLFRDEMNFLFRASLASDQQTEEWSGKARKDYPDLWNEVLCEALNHRRFNVSRNAAILVGKERIKELSPELLRLALSDIKPDIKRAARVSLARLDDLKLYEELIKKLNEPGTRSWAQTALAHIRVAADSESAPEFERIFRQRLSREERPCIQRMAWRLRFREEWPAILFIGFLAGVFGAVSAAAFKWLPGLFGLAPTQAQPSIGMGAFQGLTAGFVWAGLIALGLTLHDRVFSREHDPKGYPRPFGAVVSGAAWGLLGSIVVVFIVVSVFTTTSLVEMGWLTEENKTQSRLSYEFFKDLFVETRFGNVHLITGIGLGVGMALMTNSIRASQRWTDFVEGHKGKLFRLRQTKKALAQIARIAWHHVWPLLLMLALTGAAACLVPKVPEGAKKYYSPDLALDLPAYLAVPLGIVCDCLSQAIGGFFGIVGMGLGIIIVRYGFEFQPRKKRF